MEVWAAILAAAVPGVASLVWQVITWRRQRKPDVTVTASYDAPEPPEAAEREMRPQECGTVRITVVATQDVTVVAAGVARANRRWKPHRVECDGRAAMPNRHSLSLPVGVPAITSLWIGLSQRRLLAAGADLADGHEYLAWVKTSSGRHYYRSQEQLRGSPLLEDDEEQNSNQVG